MHNIDEHTFGANDSEWDKLIELGLSFDLLPVVSNPNAEISPNSKMKFLGKTPSNYNRARKVAGLLGWNDLAVTEGNISSWRKESDYGICLRTKEIRGGDIDVEGSNSQRIADFWDQKISAITGMMPAKRTRSNSTKCLVAFKVKGDIPKRIVKVEGGIFEFLATGQQFISAGTHPSGVKYEWEGGIEDLWFPELTLEEFEKIWFEFIKTFAIEPPVEMRVRKRGENLNLDDTLVAKLDVLDYGKDGQAYIECPFIADHTMDSGIAQTAYLPKGTNGYKRGHFKCLHAHCAGKTDNDFLEALGLSSMAFDTFSNEVDDKDNKAKIPNFIRSDKGLVEACIINLERALSAVDWIGFELGFDSFLDEVVIKYNGRNWRPVQDTDLAEIRSFLEKRWFKPLSSELRREAVSLVAKRNTFDSAQIWLNELQWDDVSRIENFALNCLGAEDSEYSKALSSYMWSALAGRILSPGIQADMAIVLLGDQGVGKTNAVKALVPKNELFCSIGFEDNHNDILRKLRGKNVVELSELSGMSGKEVEYIKTFISSTEDQLVRKYQEHSYTKPRRCIFFGTTNQHKFLKDVTGNRRFLPIEITSPDVPAIKQDCLQLWAEAKELYKNNGVVWFDAQRLATARHDDHMVDDTWRELLQHYLDSEYADHKESERAKLSFNNRILYRSALNLDTHNITISNDCRLARAMTALGYKKVSIRRDGKPTGKEYKKTEYIRERSKN